MEPAPAPPAGGPKIRLSTVVLAAIGAIGVFVLAAIYGYILVLFPADLDTKLWWMGLVSALFAIAFYLLYAASGDRRVLRPLAGAFFVISAGSYYASIFTNQDADLTKLVWSIVLSILVVAVLVGVLVMSRQAEAQATRHAQRRLTP